MAQPSARLRTKLVAVAISSLLSLAVVEVSLRLFFASHFPIIQDEKNLMYRYDATLGWFPIPGSSRTLQMLRTISAVHNRDGFRDVEHPEIKDKPRILFLGDSFVWGFEVEANERFTDKLQTRHPEWDILNCGVSGYGTDQEFLLLQRWFNQYRPQFVFLVFCTENDVVDNRWNFRHESYFKPYFITNAQNLELHGVPVPHSERSFFSGHPVLGRWFLLRLILHAYLNFHSPPLKHVPDPTRAILIAMQKFVQTKGAHFAVGLTTTDKSIQEFLAQSGIPFLDLSTTNRFPNDGHWTPAGHDFVCARIEAFLNSQDFLANPPK